MQSRSKYRCGRSEDAGLADAAAEVVLDGLSPSIKRATILDVLSHYGVIRDIVLLPSGPVNRAVITFGSKRQAARALADLTGSAAEGFLCQSDVISTDAQADPAPGLSREAAPPTDIVHIQDFSEDWDEQCLTEVFSNYGTVLACCIQHCSLGCKGSEALVKMGSVKAASKVIMALNLSKPQGTYGTVAVLPMRLQYFQLDIQGSPSIEDERVIPVVPESEPSIEAPLRANISSSMCGAKHSLFGRSTPPQTGAPLTKLSPEASILQAQLSSDTSIPTLSNLWDAEHITPTSRIAANQGNTNSQASGDLPLATGTVQTSISGSLPQNASKSIYVSNLPSEADSLWVYERFAPYGGILSVKVLQEQKSGKCRGVCFVNYIEPEGAISAIKSLDGIRIAGRILQVKLQGKRR